MTFFRAFPGVIRGTALIAALVPAMPAMASTTSTNMTVQTVVPNSCTLSNVVNIAFSNPSGTTITQTDNAGSVDVTCTNGGTYTVSANNGANALVNQRRMQSNRSGSTATLNYGLYTDTGRTNAFTTSSQLIGNGAAQTFSIYGRMPAQTATEAGTYVDTVQLTVSY